MAPLIRRCICILNSNCYKSGDFLGEKWGGNQTLNKNTRDSVPAQWDLEEGGPAWSSLFCDVELIAHHKITAPGAIYLPGSYCSLGQ